MAAALTRRMICTRTCLLPRSGPQVIRACAVRLRLTACGLPVLLLCPALHTCVDLGRRGPSMPTELQPDIGIQQHGE